MNRILTTLLLVAALMRVDLFWVQMTWDVNEEPDLAGYGIVYKVPPGEVWKTHNRYDGLPVKNGRTGKWLPVPITGLEYHVAVVAYDTSDNDSARSENIVAIDTTALTVRIIAPTPRVNTCQKMPLPPTK